MEDYKDIIDVLQKLKQVETPEVLAEQVMAKLANADTQEPGRTHPYLFLLRVAQNDTTAISSGPVTSHRQCAFLLFLVGFFYLVAGLTTAWRFYDAVGAVHLNTWLSIQPLIAAGSGMIMIIIAFLILYRPRTAFYVQYILILHLVFIFVNALILEKTLYLPVAWIYVLILTMLAVVLSLLLISSIRSARKFQPAYEESNCE